MNVNQVVLIGHSTRDPDVRNVGTDSKVAVIRLAVNRSYKKGNEWIDKTTFVDCEAWNQKAEYIERSIQTGTEVYVRGRLETDEWETKDTGEKRSKLKVYILELQVGNKRKDAKVAVGASDSEEIDMPF